MDSNIVKSRLSETSIALSIITLNGLAPAIDDAKKGNEIHPGEGLSDLLEPKRRVKKKTIFIFILVYAECGCRGRGAPRQY